ncbi:hypothetical protein [Candidatus Kinetoplastidibacterium stringomonadis]|uniref:hypothetical protein n=1 Tax=Candidatus Kinetoplastidibacterium stringomonadis TaxID=994696 RepID=UPI003898E067
MSDWLVEKEELEIYKISIYFIKNCAENNPGKITGLLNTNLSSLFFSYSDFLNQKLVIKELTV